MWNLPCVCFTVDKKYKEQRAEGDRLRCRQKEKWNRRQVSAQQKQNREGKTGPSTGNRVQPIAPVLALALSYLISRFIFPWQLHTLFVQPCWQRQLPSKKATVFTSHLLISAAKPSKHVGDEGEEREGLDEEKKSQLRRASMTEVKGIS